MMLMMMMAWVVLLVDQWPPRLAPIATVYHNNGVYYSYRQVWWEGIVNDSG